MRLTSQRGVSLLLLIIMITVFAGVAIGVVTLLRSRHESYPYQVQSYQAYALAHAGAEFAIQYVKENNVDLSDPNSFLQHPELYIPTDGSYKDFSFGNGKFSLRYVPGCPDTLYSRGTVGIATREVILSNFGLSVGAQGNSVYLASATTMTRTCYGNGLDGLHPCTPADPFAGPYYGDRIQVSFCQPNAPNPNYPNAYFLYEGDTGLGGTAMTIAARSLSDPTKQVTLGRVGFRDNLVTPSPGNPLSAYWVWDATCGITGDAAAGTPPYCPGPFVQGINNNYGCPITLSGYYGTYPNAGRGYFDCVTSGTSGYFNGAKLPVWDGTSIPPNAPYPVHWNTSQFGSASTLWDATCRPKVPADPVATDYYGVDPCCLTGGCASGTICPTMDQTVCNPVGDPKCSMGTSPSLWMPTSIPVVYAGHYSCFDTEKTCIMGHGDYAARSRATCYMPQGGPWGTYTGSGTPRRSYEIPAGLNRLTIETFNQRLDNPNILPVKFYVEFQTWYSQAGGQHLSPVTNRFVFTVR